MFTTQSVTAVLEKIRQQIKGGSPAPAVFTLPADGNRAVYPLNTLSSIVFNRQTGSGQFQPATLPVAEGLNVIPNSVSSIAFGRYSSPDYETAQQFIPPYDTGFGTPVVQRNNDIYFRNDLAFAANAAIPKNPHTFLTNLLIVASAPLAVATQNQIATFLASDGTLTIDPDGAGPLFETPIMGPLPETLNLLP
jgi:hypothetical protein